MNGLNLIFYKSLLLQNNFEKLVSRMTRFFVKTDLEKTLEILCKSLEDNALTWKASAPGQVSNNIIRLRLIFFTNLYKTIEKLQH